MYMTLVIPTGFSQIGLLLRDDLTGRTGEITFGLNWPGNTADFDVFQTALFGFAQNIVQDCTTNISTDSAVMTQAVVGGGTGSVIVPLGATVEGASSGSPMTPNVSYLYRKYTSSLGRKQRGRFYLPGVSETDVDGAGVIEPSTLTDMTNHAASALEELGTVFLDDPFTMVLLHSDPALAPSPVNQLVPEAVVATQRRRLVR